MRKFVLIVSAPRKGKHSKRVWQEVKSSCLPAFPAGQVRWPPTRVSALRFLPAKRQFLLVTFAKCWLTGDSVKKLCCSKWKVSRDNCCYQYKYKTDLNNLASQLINHLGWIYWCLNYKAVIFSWSTGHCKGQSKSEWRGHVEQRRGVLAVTVHTGWTTVHWSFGHWEVKKLVSSMMIRYILTSEVSLIPGRVIHALQNSPDNPLQLLSRSLLLLQRPPHPLVVLDERKGERENQENKRNGLLHFL